MIRYRSEIDGLRALAVIPVVLFHAGFSTFGGGYVGVDVFFVISGYLITAILRKDMGEGGFSLAGFYERRARRILPALFLVMLISLPLAWLILLPEGMVEFSKSLIAVSLFGSNFLFWQTSGYFNSATEMKPMIHAWSLSVEEQFYVFFPLFLLIFWRFGKKTLVGLLAVAAAISLGLAQWGVVTKPVFTFYLLPTRAWELLLGALVAFYYTESTIQQRRPWFAEVGSFVGIFLIGFSIFAYDEKTPFPSLYALAPTIGALLVIIFSTSQTWVGRLLGSKPLVWFGLISYSLYLWHQPLFAFARHAMMDEPSHVFMLLLMGLAVVLAYLTWRFVEKPFRDKSCVSLRQVIVASLACSFTLIGFGLTGVHTKGLPYARYSDDKAAFLVSFENSAPQLAYIKNNGILDKYRNQCNFYDVERRMSRTKTKVPLTQIDDECFMRNATYPYAVFVWGDSHAQQFYFGLNAELPKDWQILQVASSGCPARLGAKPSTTDFCEQSNWFALQAIHNAKPDVVLIGQNSDHDLENMKKLSDALHAVGVKRVIFAGPVPHWRSSLPSIVSRLWDSVPEYTMYGLDRQVLDLDQQLRVMFPADARAQYVSVIDALCDGAGCRIYIGPDIKAGITSWDSAHLTPIASELVARRVLVPEIVGDASAQ